MDKEHILNEIKRTAKDNNGVALGRERFFKETGIKYTDWHGKFWVRWNDAIKEAELSPNQMQSAYEEEELMMKFIAFMREIKKFPINGELRMKAYQDKNFPSSSTFHSRLGNKNHTAQKIAKYCKEHEGYDDIFAMCNEILENKQLLENDTKIPDDFVIGYVYLIKSGKYYKIGRSNAIGRREYELAIQLPEKGETIHTIRTDDPIGIEAYWHNRFNVKRKNGEWFELTSADISAFKRRKFM